jgi:hypothetical protein
MMITRTASPVTGFVPDCRTDPDARTHGRGSVPVRTAETYSESGRDAYTAGYTSRAGRLAAAGAAARVRIDR